MTSHKSVPSVSVNYATNGSAKKSNELGMRVMQERAQLDIQIKDRFGQPVVPREWFLVPLFVIDELVEKIKDGTISDYEYDPKTACLKQGG
ncbi:MAG: hypothetical protein K9G26_07865 [Emcibacter sp.]|nr:hypothetical protein [Emcibacter sp.]